MNRNVFGRVVGILRRIRRRLQRKYYSVAPMAEYLKACPGVEIIDISASEESTIPGPKFAGSYTFDVPMVDDVEVSSPRIQIFRLKNVQVMGTTSWVIHNGVALYPDVMNLDKEMFTAEVQGAANYLPDRRQLQVAPNGALKTVDKGISLLGECTGNYAHWLLETLPKLAILEKHPEFRDHKLLVDGWIHPVFFESLALLNTSCHEIVRIDRFRPVQVNDLVYISPPAYTPPENRAIFRSGARPTPSASTYCLSAKAITEMREKAWSEAARYVLPDMSLRGLNDIIRVDRDGDSSKVLIVKHKGPNQHDYAYSTAKRIYLRRVAASAGNPRMLVHQHLVESLLARFGFLAVDPAGIPFVQQALLLREAECVVAPLGASMANLVFAPPGVNVIGLSPYYRGADYYYFSNLLGGLGHRLKYVLGPQVDKVGVHWQHQDYFVDLGALEAELKELFPDKPVQD